MAETKALISFAVTAKLICVFVFAYAKSRFSHNEAHIEVSFPNLSHPQLFIKDEFLELKDGNFFADLQTILPTCFIG